MNDELLLNEYKDIVRLFTSCEDDFNEIYQEAFSRVYEKRTENLKHYWYITVRNISRAKKGRIIYTDELPDTPQQEGSQISDLVYLLEGDLQRHNSEDERVCKYIVWQYIKFGSIRQTAIALGLTQKTIKRAIDDYINNTSIGEHGTHN